MENVYLKPGVSYNVLAVVVDPNSDKLTFRYELLPEPTKVGEGGDFEERPKAIDNAVSANTNNGKASLKAPATEGAYRLFVYITDGHNNVATANVPFFVRN